MQVFKIKFMEVFKLLKRVFLIVLDSFGIGQMPDAKAYGDDGCNTLASVSASRYFKLNNLERFGLFNIDGVKCREDADELLGAYARMTESSVGKDTTIGHWEIAGVKSTSPLPTYPNGFPSDLIEKFEQATGRKVICNKPYSGTDVIKDYGQEHEATGALIVYTSADSVFQIAAHEKVVPINQLYKYCEIARNLLQGEHAVGRVIARPFEGIYPNYVRTSRRHDYSLAPPKDTMLDYLSKAGKDVIAVGKIYDIFAGKGITEYVRTMDNNDGMAKTLEYADENFEGLCFVNLVDFDMKYGHRNDIDGYAKALADFDTWFPNLLEHMKKDDILMITADHGCDPGAYWSTDHSREYTPLIVAGKKIKCDVNLGTLSSFADIGATILDYFDIDQRLDGESFKDRIMKGV